MAKGKTVKWLVTGGLVLGVALMGGTAWATNMFGPSNTCTELNCGSQGISGTVTQFGPTAQPWVAEIFASPGRCMRVAVVSEGADLKTVVTAPDGEVFRNDDGFAGNCPLCPVVKIANTPNNGWYTVSINYWNGAPVSTNFTLHYSLYNLGNPNCSGATVPVHSVEPNTNSNKGPAVSPQHSGEGTPGAP